MKLSLRLFAIVLISCSVAFAQKGSSGGSTSGSGSSGSKTGPAGNTPTNVPTRPTPNVQQQMPMPIFLTGRVVMDDGTPPPERVAIQRTCSGRTWKEGNTDSKGYFSITVGGGRAFNPEMQDASTSGYGGDSMGMGMPGAMGSNSTLGGTPMNAINQLFGCELLAEMPGTISERLELTSHHDNTDPNVGTIVLHRIGKVDGTSVSVTSLQAPKDARKAFENGRKEFKKKHFDKAKAALTHAVDVYPGYAEAWSVLAEVQMHDKDYANAISSSQKAIAADSHFIAPYFTLITASASQQDWKNTAQYADKLISLDAYHYPAAYYYDALAYMQMNDLEKANASIIAARKYDVSSALPKAALLMGEILMRRQDYAGAVGAYKAYLEREPTGPSSEFARNELNAAQTKLAAVTAPAPAPKQ